MSIKQKDKKARPNFRGQFFLLRDKFNAVSDLGGRKGNLGNSSKSKGGQCHFKNFRRDLCIC